MRQWINCLTNDRAVKTAVLLLMGIFLYTRVTSGTIAYYINERFFTLTLIAGIGFVVLSLVYLRAWWAESAVGQEAHHDHSHDISWLGLLIICVPLVLGWLVPPQPLGAAAVGNREINIGGLGLQSIAPPSGNEAVGIITGERNILDWIGEFRRHSDPTALDGQPASVIGFVYRDERFGETRFMVSRFTVSCCVADAAPVGLIVEWPEAATLPANQWVEVNGRFAAGSFAGSTVPILQAERVEITVQPKQPYLHL